VGTYSNCAGIYYKSSLVPNFICEPSSIIRNPTKCAARFLMSYSKRMVATKELDKKRLREVFFQTYDEGRALDRMTKLAFGSHLPGLSLIGEGMHFRCWREERTGPMDLVYKVANQEFLSEVGNLSSWIAKLAKMPSGIDLMPPNAMVLINYEGIETVGVTMPFGPEPEDLCGAWWLPMTERLAEFKDRARHSGLILGDIPQIRCWNRIPFLIDISDLRAS